MTSCLVHHWLHKPLTSPHGAFRRAKQNYLFYQDRVAFNSSLSTYLRIYLHGLNVSVYRLSLSILSTFSSAPFKHREAFLSPCTCLFLSFFPSHILTSQCVVLCMAHFLCWGWRGEILEQQGSSLVTHRFWNHSMSRRQREGNGKGHREEESNNKEENKGRRRKDE